MSNPSAPGLARLTALGIREPITSFIKTLALNPSGSERE
jgi:hypothetical protein